MSFEMKMSRELGEALISWDERLHGVWQTLHHARLMIEPLQDMGLKDRAKDATTIYDDVDNQLRRGVLVARMMKRHSELYPVLRGPVASEVFRQFNNVLHQSLFASLSEDREQEVATVLEAFLDAARAAVEEQEGDTDE